MPIQRVGHQQGMSAGLSSWLDRLAGFLNNLELDVKGRPGLEQAIAGRQDAQAQALRAQIEELRRVNEEAQAGLRSQLSAEQQARLSAEAAVEGLVERVAVLEAGGDARDLALASFQFPVSFGGDELRVLTSTSWAKIPGSEEHVIRRPPRVLTTMLVAGDVFTTSSAVTGMLRFRDIVTGAVVSSASGSITSSHNAVVLNLSLPDSSGTYVVEGQVVRGPGARASDGLRCGSLSVKVRLRQ